MKAIEATRKPLRKKKRKKRTRAAAQKILSVVSVRFSDEEKARMDEIMRWGNLRRYSDVLRMAIKIYQVPDHVELGSANTCY